jgi:hypothetical protein
MKIAALLIALVLALSAGAVEAKPLRGNPCVQEIIRAAQEQGLTPGLKLYHQCAGR